MRDVPVSALRPKYCICCLGCSIVEGSVRDVPPSALSPEYCICCPGCRRLLVSLTAKKGIVLISLVVTVVRAARESCDIFRVIITYI